MRRGIASLSLIVIEDFERSQLSGEENTFDKKLFPLIGKLLEFDALVAFYFN